MKKYGNLFDYVSNSLAGRYNIDDNVFKVKLIKYLAYYLSHAEACDDYIISLGDFNSNFTEIGKKVNRKVKLVGLGGVGGNFLTYIVKCSVFFDEIIVYEKSNEYVEFQNCLRYYIFNPFGLILKNELFFRLANLFGRRDIIFSNDTYIPDKSDCDYIVIGAPDIDTRRKIIDLNLNYIFILHSNDQFYIFSNLSGKFRKYEISNAPLEEGYGIITLSTFFSNLLKIFKEVVEVMMQ